MSDEMTNQPEETVSDDLTDEQAKQVQDTEQDPKDAETGAEGRSGANQEAAKYRIRAKEAETARDEALQRVEALQWQIIAGSVPATTVTVDAIRAAGYGIADLTDDAGDVDSVRLQEATRDVEQRFGLKRPVIVPTEGGPGRSGGQGGDWEKAFSPNRD